MAAGIGSGTLPPPGTLIRIKLWLVENGRIDDGYEENTLKPAVIWPN